MKKKILMVCLGNICRSPMADGLLRKKVNELGINIGVDSAGTGNWHIGEAPDPRMIKTGAKNGTPIDFLRARQFKTNDFNVFDEIYVMDKNNYNNVIALAQNESDRNKVKLIMDLKYPGEEIPVPDPYYGGEQGFQEVYEMLDEITEIIVKNLLEDE